jgi:nucleoside 2-deoxyribosyltransferase
MSTIYVAGPMTGLPEFNYPAFEAAEKALAERGHLVLNPVHADKHNPTPGTSQAWDWYMRHCIRMVLEADGVALLPGWETSRGATLEHTIATALDLDIRPLDAWLMTAAVR